MEEGDVQAVQLQHDGSDRRRRPPAPAHESARRVPPRPHGHGVRTRELHNLRLIKALTFELLPSLLSSIASRRCRRTATWRAASGTSTRCSSRSRTRRVTHTTPSSLRVRISRLRLLQRFISLITPTLKPQSLRSASQSQRNTTSALRTCMRMVALARLGTPYSFV